MIKAYLQKLFDYKFITIVTDIDALFEKVKDMDLSEALTYLKERELFTQVIDNDKVIALLDDTDENIVTSEVDPEDEPTVDPDDEPTVDPDDEPTVDPDDEPTVDPDDSPVVDEGDDE